MGCDIHMHGERRDSSGWNSVDITYEEVIGGHRYDSDLLGHRNYGVFGFLADVRNYSDVPAIASGRGLPDNCCSDIRADYERWYCDAHNTSWVMLDELFNFDYGRLVEDRRVTRQTGLNSWNGGMTCNPGEGLYMTYREFLGEHYFRDLVELNVRGVERLVFWFDN